MSVAARCDRVDQESAHALWMTTRENDRGSEPAVALQRVARVFLQQSLARRLAVAPFAVFRGEPENLFAGAPPKRCHGHAKPEQPSLHMATGVCATELRFATTSAS